MGSLTRLAIALVFLLCSTAFARPAEQPTLPSVQANDNRTPAGHRKNGVLELHLELRGALWYPEEEGGAHREVYAFAEEGHAPQISGPLIRVPQGTQINATVHNTLPLAAKLYGLHRHPGDPKDAVLLAPGETKHVLFLAGDPGTYLYWATTSDKSMEDRDQQETLLIGAFVTDPLGAVANDRILVLGIWSKAAAPDDFTTAINGKSWPYTERLTYKLGENIHWRVINASNSEHARHLHGFYFNVNGVGDGEHFENYSPEQRRLVVTEYVDIARVFDMTWTAERAGNWLFHCHMLLHMSPTSPPAPAPGSPPPDSSSAAHDHGMGMNGLIMGITVLPGATLPPNPSAAVPTRKFQLVISDNPGKIPLYKVEFIDPLKSSPSEPNQPPSLLGAPILLTRGERTEIEVKNQSSNPTVIHWHGIEIESYYDGVPGWAGTTQQNAPPIPPGTSFIARMTPPRAGTFIYHTHWHDGLQIRSGLYGPLIVLEPGQKYDPDRDKTFVFSVGNYDPFGFLLLMNGTPQPVPLELHAGTLYRLRFANITSNSVDLRVRLTIKDVPVQWKVVAVDGADLPAAQLKSSTADLGVTVGSTVDVEYQADAPGFAELKISEPAFFGPVTQVLQFVAPK
jgi:FtsP/CotA-like multicopper oxidase with cupredoxin domain